MTTALTVTDQDLDTAARTLYGEARGEPLEGQHAVAWVFRNRTEWTPPAWWGTTLHGVCRQPFQFSCWNSNDANFGMLTHLPTDDALYRHCYEVVRAVMAGEVEDPSGGATHYEVLGTGASWAKNREFSVIIGRHAFYAIGPSA